MKRRLAMVALALLFASSASWAQQTDPAADKPAASPAPAQPAEQSADKPAATPAPAVAPAPAQPAAQGSSKPGVGGVKTVAIVAFSVPRSVAEESAGGLSALSAIGRIASSGFKGNGGEVARDAIAGFIEQMNQGRIEIVGMDRVLGNDQFKALRAKHDQSTQRGGQAKLGLAGLPIIVLSKSQERSEFAGQAAKAIDVDGVILVDINTLNYFLYTGVSGNGQAKARGAGLFKLYDREGRAVWEAGAVVWTEASAGMVGGAIAPSSAAILHKDVGQTIAKDLQKKYPAGN